MKWFLLVIFLLISQATFCQNNKKLIYEKTKHSSYLVTPIDEPQKFLGAPGILIWSEKQYIEDLIDNTITAVIPEKVRDYLSPSTGYIFALNKKGEISNWRLLLNFKDTSKITEKQIYSLYLKFKEIKIDMNKVRIEPDYSGGWKKADYIMWAGSLKSWKMNSTNF